MDGANTAGLHATDERWAPSFAPCGGKCGGNFLIRP